MDVSFGIDLPTSIELFCREDWYGRGNFLLAEITGIGRRRYNENHNDNEIYIFAANGDKPTGGACKKTVSLTSRESLCEYCGE